VTIFDLQAVPKPVADKGMKLLVVYQKARRRRRFGSAAGRFMVKRRAAFYRQAWEDAARDTGATLTHLDPADASLLEISIDQRRLLVSDHVTSLDDPVTLEVAGNKPLVYRLMQERGVPIPRHVVCSAGDLATAQEFLRALGRPCVVKPAWGTGAGRGVTAGVRESRDLVGALAAAAAWCSQVIVEEQVPGNNYRLLYLDGRLLDAICRRPPVVTGDGRHTLRQLIAGENRRRIEGGMAASQTLIPIDRELRHTLRAGGHRLRDVPAAGRVVQLRTVINDNRREDNRPAAAELCAAVIESGAAAARAVGARLAGVDIITPDAARPLAEAGGAVIEVNTTPGHYHHFTDPADPGRIARLILEHLREVSP